MHCPFCHAEETKVIDSRLTEDGLQVRRRRECTRCNERVTTFETAELAYPRIVKRDEQRCLFDVEKLKAGMLRALEKRPVSTVAVDASVKRLLQKIRTCGEQEVRSQWLGECVMGELCVLDQVAYVRFASVYRSFKDVEAFSQEVQRLKNEKS